LVSSSPSSVNTTPDPAPVARPRPTRRLATCGVTSAATALTVLRNGAMVDVVAVPSELTG
jgi:hypothetical protein